MLRWSLILLGLGLLAVAYALDTPEGLYAPLDHRSECAEACELHDRRTIDGVVTTRCGSFWSMRHLEEVLGGGEHRTLQKWTADYRADEAERFPNSNGYVSYNYADDSALVRYCPECRAQDWLFANE